MKRLLISAFALLFSLWAYNQDVRTLETKVADMLARMPVYNQDDLFTYMKLMTDIEDRGWDKVCSGIIEPGTGDDTRARFLVESYSRYLSEGIRPEIRDRWEAKCIEFISSSDGLNTKRFFFNQLKIAGGEKASEFSCSYIDNTELAESALSVIALVGDKKSEELLADKLKDRSISTAASIMNTLALLKSDIATEEYIMWYNSGSPDERNAALNALAKSADPGALKTLESAAKKADYSWERTRAVDAYLNYASELADRGDRKKADKICNEIIKKAGENSIQYKANALSLKVKIDTVNAPKLLISYFDDKNTELRNHALALAVNLAGEDASSYYMDALTDVEDKYVPGIIHMLGERGDLIVVPLIKELINNADRDIRLAALQAMVVLKGKEAAGDLISYMHLYPDIEDQEKLFSLYSTIADKDRLNLMADSYPQSGELSKAFTLMLLAQSGDNKYFNLMLAETGSDYDLVRNAAYVSLKNIVSEEDIPELIGLLKIAGEREEIIQIQSALVMAANQIADKEKRADLLLDAASEPELLYKVIPVLKGVGGSKALKLVLDNFYRAEAGLKELCFDALAGWLDSSASYALFDICSSDDNSFLKPAFEGYIRQVTGADITGEQKLLLLRKIMPYAKTHDLKVKVLSNISDINTIPALMFAAAYFDDNVINQVAIRSAIRIALPADNGRAGLYGDNVRLVLEDVIALLKGDGSEYDIQRVSNYLEEMSVEKGFVSMFNGRDLSGWQGLVEDPVSRSKMSGSELARKQEEANKKMKDNWSVKDNAIWFSGAGANLCSIKEYADFEMLVDWRITKKGDSGIYLRGTPQVQIWDTSRVEVGAQVGSGGLYNNVVNKSDPILVADNPVGDWNTFRIIMIGERVSVWLNGEMVVDDVIMENYWDRSIPIFPKGAIELQAHGNELAFRDIYIREINSSEYKLTEQEKTEGFESLFNGSNLDNWIGDKTSYVVEDGTITVKPGQGSGGNLYTGKEYSNFNFRFEFKLTEGANNGLGIRAPLEGDAAYVGMELQILDNRADIYASLEPYQYHGSVYGVIPAKRGFLKPLDEWNSEEVIVEGTHIRVILNGEVIVDGDIADARDNGTMDHRDHPGLKRDKGHIGFLGHGSVLCFRNIRIKELD